jgi:hypothetical protein
MEHLNVNLPIDVKFAEYWARFDEPALLPAQTRCRTTTR